MYEGFIYAIRKEQLSIAQRIELLKQIKEFYEDLEIYEFCETINDVIRDYKHGEDLDKASFQYSIIINKYIKDTK